MKNILVKVCPGTSTTVGEALVGCLQSGNCQSSCSPITCPVSSTCVACMMKPDAQGGCATEVANCQSDM